MAVTTIGLLFEPPKKADGAPKDAPKPERVVKTVAKKGKNK